MFTKFATATITGVKASPTRLGREASLSKFADYDDFRTDDGYVYVRVRAISSRVNKNHDGWPAAELAKSYKTFLGKPLFVDHNNHDPERARGVVVDAKIHVEDDKTSALDPYYSNAPKEHMPATWVELLLEVDAKRFPKLAKAIVSGDIDGVSMGCNVERSKCSHCGNWATNPDDYCQHIRNKGAEFDYYRDGRKIAKKSYEDCYDIGFFELSFVFDPADETALFLEKPRTSSVHEAFDPSMIQHGLQTGWDAFKNSPASGPGVMGGLIAYFAAMWNKIAPQAPNWKALAAKAPTAEAFIQEAHQLEEQAMASKGSIQGQGLMSLQRPENWDEMLAQIWETAHSGQQPDEQMEVPGQNLHDPGVEQHAIDPSLEAMSNGTGVGSMFGAEKKNWIEDAVKKPGQLHKDLGVPEGEKIPEDKLEEAKNSDDPKERERAQFAENVKKKGSYLQARSAGVGDLVNQGLDAAMGTCPNCGVRKPPLASNCKNCGKYIRQVRYEDTDPTIFDKPDPRQGKTADTNQIPQSEMTVAPEKVDTLRQENVCPICGSMMEDGICEVCNFEEPPEGFGNPDLTKAQDTDDMQQQQGMEAEDASQQSMNVQDAQAQGQAMPQQQPPGMPMAASYNSGSTERVTSEHYAADLAGGRVNTKEKPLLPGIRQTTDNPKNQKTVSDSPKNVESSTKEEMMSNKTADTNAGEELAGGKRVNPEGVGGVDGDENPDGHKTVSVDGVGAVDNDENPKGHKEVDLQGGLLNEVGGPTDTWSGKGGGDGDSLGQQNPVTNAGSGVLGHKKIEILAADTVEGDLATSGGKVMDLDSSLKNEVGGPTSTWSTADSFHETDPVTTEAYPSEGGVTSDGGVDPAAGDPYPNAEEGIKPGEHGDGGGSDHTLGRAQYRTHMITAMKLAETEIALGITPEDEKFDRIAELESESPDSLKARLDTVSRVKTAGLAKKVAGANRPKPSFQTTGSVTPLRSEPVEVDEDAESIFS